MNETRAEPQGEPRSVRRNARASGRAGGGAKAFGAPDVEARVRVGRGNLTAPCAQPRCRPEAWALASAGHDGLGAQPGARCSRRRLIRRGRARARTHARDTGEPRGDRWWDQAVAHLVHAQGRSGRSDSRARARLSSVGLAHSPRRRLSGTSPSALIGKRPGGTHAGRTRRHRGSPAARAGLPRGTRIPDASAPCSCRLRSPSAHLSAASLDASLRPSGSCPIPPTEDRQLPVSARLRRSGLGLTTVHSYKDTRPPEPCRGGAGRKWEFCGDSTDGEAMARRWRGDGEGTRWRQVGTGRDSGGEAPASASRPDRPSERTRAPWPARPVLPPRPQRAALPSARCDALASAVGLHHSSPLPPQARLHGGGPLVSTAEERTWSGPHRRSPISLRRFRAS